MIRYAILLWSILIAEGVAILPAAALLPAGVTIEKDVRVDEPEFARVFETQRFYPGQKVSILVRGSIDANHSYWDDRVCSWFGLKCWYEPRESSTIVDTRTFPVLVAVKDANGQEPAGPAQIATPSFTDRPDKSLSIALTTPQQFVVPLEIVNADGEPGAFGRYIEFSARIADRGNGGAALYRNRCEGRPSHCGGGSYRITVVDVDNSARVASLRRLLTQKRSPSSIIPVLKQDVLLTNDPTVGHRALLARLLFEQAQNFWGEDVQPEKLEYLEYAVELDRSSATADISNELAKTHLASGNVALAKIENEKTFQVVQKEYEEASTGNRLTDAIITNYYNALRVAAQIGTVERAAIQSSDLIRAVGVYIVAADVAQKGSSLSSITKEVRRKFARWSYEAYVDASRLLMMMRTPENLAQAEKLLDEAVKRSNALQSIK